MFAFSLLEVVGCDVDGNVSPARDRMAREAHVTGSTPHYSFPVFVFF